MNEGIWGLGERVTGGFDCGIMSGGLREREIVVVMGTQIEWIERSLTSLWLRCE